MHPRHGLITGASIAGVVAVVLAFAPTDWLAELLAVDGPDATTFLVRRYAASATAAVFVATASIARRAEPRRASLYALATWFGVQGAVAVAGVLSSTVGGLVWVAIVADPALALWFLTLTKRVEDATSTRS